MGTVISNLKAKFGVDSSDFKKGMKDGERAVGEFKNEAGNKLDELGSMFGVNMGAINSSIGTAVSGMKGFSTALGLATGASGKLTVALKLVKVALASTGIGLLIVALGSLVSYFKDTGAGADKFAVIMAKVKSVIDNVVDRLQSVGKGLVEIFSGNFKQGINDIIHSFDEFGQEVKNDWKESGELADALDVLEDKEIALITVQAERTRKIAELREASRDLEYTERERLRFTEDAESNMRAYYADAVALEEERYRIMKRQLEISASDPTDDQRRELQEQLAKINELYAQQANEIRSLSREKNTLVTAVEKENAILAARQELEGMPIVTPIKFEVSEVETIDLSKTLAPVYEFAEEVKSVMLDISDEISATLEELFNGIGEFFGSLATGETDLKGFAVMVANTFADMAVNVGKLAIGTGVATLGIKAALESMNPYAAIAAGVALVALGTAVKGSLKSVASGGSSGVTSSGATSYNVTGKTIDATAQKVEISGELTAKGSDLVYVFGRESKRKTITT